MNKFGFVFFMCLLPYCYSVYKCKCKVNVGIKCRANATDDDLFAACHQQCGQNVSVLWVHNPLTCLKDTLQEKCKQIKTVYIDNSTLCDCYCNVTTPGFSVKPAPGREHPIDCYCFKPDPSTTTQIVPITTSKPAAGIFIPESVLIGIGATILALLLVGFVLTGLIYKKDKLKEYYQKVWPAKTVENQGLVFNEN